MTSNNAIVDSDLQGHLIDGFAVYQKYLSIRLHFNPDRKYSYNSVRSGRPSNVIRKNSSRTSFERRDNAIHFSKIAKKFKGNLRKIEDYLIANILLNPYWGGDNLINDESMVVYKEYLGRVESLMYLFERDNKHLRDRAISEYQKMGETERFLLCKNTTKSLRQSAYELVNLNSVYFNICVLERSGTQPLIVRETLGSRISVETLTLFCAVSQCHKDWDHDDPTINMGMLRLMPYASLLEFDEEAVENILRKVWMPPKNQ